MQSHIVPTMPDPTASFGVVFDLDGVLIDSHDQHERSWCLLAEEIGRELTPEQFNASFGMRNEQCIPEVFGWTGVEDRAAIASWGARKEEIYRELLAKDGLEPLPGVLDLVRALGERGVPFSLGSSTSRKNIEVCFASTGLDRCFGPRYTGAEDVSRGKPAPDVFLEAARQIDRAPQRCVVVEDAHVGIEAALAAGMKAVAVTTTHPAASFAGSGADLVVPSLEALDPEQLRRLVLG